MEITIPQTPGYVGLRLFQPEYEPSGELSYFTVEIMNPSIRAIARIYAYLRVDDFSEVFETMARNWKGWNGSLKCESLEGDFCLECTSDKQGHVWIAISLKESDYIDGWRVQAKAQTEAGQLDELAVSTRRFFNKNKGIVK